MQVVLFEDRQVRRLMPLVALKPVYGMTVGCRTIREKFERHLPGMNLSFHLRRALAPVYRESFPDVQVNSVVDDDLLLVNGRIICDAAVGELIARSVPESGTALVQDGELLFARLPASLVLDADGLFDDCLDGERLKADLRCISVEGFRLLSFLWDAVALHTDELLRDASFLPLGRIEGAVHPSAVIVNPSNVFVAPGAVVRAGAVIDGGEGFVAIGEGAIVEPQAVVMENVYAGSSCRIKAGARVYSNVSIGRGSKIGGEVEDCIIEAYANKQHDGFLGHSYLSHWCNLGAGTSTSDLKNNYSAVRILQGGRHYETELQFLGLLMGEHSRSAINSAFNTGTVAGMAANVFGAGFPPKEIPSFAWGGSGGFEAYGIEPAVQTARKVMARRGVVMSAAYEALFRFMADAPNHSIPE